MSPADARPSDPRTLVEMLDRGVERGPDRVAYRHKRDGQWIDVTWSAHARRVDSVAKALMACGVEPGDRVAILSSTRLEWIEADGGILVCGAVAVGIYASTVPDDCAYVLDHAEVGVLIVDRQAQLDKIESVRARLPRLGRIVIFDGASDAARGVVAWSEFLRSGANVSDDALLARRRAVDPTDLATLVYTSGTTGVPKGVMLTHGNWAFTTGSATQCLEFLPEYHSLLFLPLAHVFARLMVYCAMRRGCTVAIAESLERVAENLVETQPHFVAGVPRFYEKIHETVMARVAASGALSRALFGWALAIGRMVSRRGQRGQRPGAALRVLLAIADRLVLHRVRGVFGGRLVWAVSGAAPLAPAVSEFYDACGVRLLEGIGMTENTSFSSVNRADHNRFGTVGTPGPGIEMAIAPDGEILCRGENVMKGYFRDPEATAQTIDPQGWLHTGDVGEISKDGSLKVTDRKKDLIITSGGKNVAPARIELLLRRSPFVSQALAYGDRQKYITAILTLEAEHLKEWARARGLTAASHEELVGRPEVHALVAREVEEANRSLASYESVKRFTIHPREFTVEAGELTPTLKLKRKVILERYGKALEELYASPR